MSNPDYWQERAEKRIHRAHKNSDKTIKEITAAYQQAIDDINSDIEKIFYRYAGKNDLSSAEAKDILNQRISENEWNKIKLQISSIKDPAIKKQLRAKLEASAYGARIDRLEALKQDIYIKTKQVADVELQKSTELYRKTVEDNYLHNVFDFQQGTGYAYEFASMSPEHVEEILKNNWSGKHYSKSVWDNTDVLAEKLQQTLAAGLMSGKSYKRMAAELTELTSYGQYAAERLIRTETAYLIEESDKAAAIDRGTKVRIFRATLDLKTSKICQEHDGDRVPIEKSVPGKNVPPLHPHCRSWMEEEIEGYEHRIRAAKDPVTGERITVPADMTYTDWKENYSQLSEDDDVLTKFKRKVKSSISQVISGKEVISYSEVPENIRKPFEAQLKRADPYVRKILTNYYSQVDYRVGTEKSRNISVLNVVDLAKNVVPGSIAHELFHVIDRDRAVTQIFNFNSALRKDFDVLKRCADQSKMGLKEYLYAKYPDAFENSKTMGERYRGISDILSGLTKGNVKFGYGHSKDYWKLSEDRLSMEAWAQFGRIGYENDEEVIQMLKDIFPQFAKEALETLKGLIT